MEITIKGPKNTIKERFKLDNRINPAPTISIYNNSYNYTDYSINKCTVTSTNTKYLRSYISSNASK